MSRKRERTVIIHDILKAIQEKGEKTKPTHILYRSNLSSQMMKEYLTELIEKGFVIEEQQKKRNRVYSLTEKGYRYLKDYIVIRNFLESYDLEE